MTTSMKFICVHDDTPLAYAKIYFDSQHCPRPPHAFRIHLFDFIFCFFFFVDTDFGFVDTCVRHVSVRCVNSEHTVQCVKSILVLLVCMQTQAHAHANKYYFSDRHEMNKRKKDRRIDSITTADFSSDDYFFRSFVLLLHSIHLAYSQFPMRSIHQENETKQRRKTYTANGEENRRRRKKKLHKKGNMLMGVLS